MSAGKVVLARIAQQLPTRAQDNGQLTGIDVKTFDQRLRLRLGLRIERLMRVTVAAEKALQPKHVAVVRAADDHRPARPRLQEADTAQNEGAHDPFSELGFCDQQGPQPLRRDN